jgi:hypothetical protein
MTIPRNQVTLVILTFALATVRGHAVAQQPVADQQYPLKAAYLLNFGNLVTWPKEAFDPNEPKFVIGVLGGDPFGATLQRIEREKTVNQPGVGPMKIRVHRFKSMDEYQPCHILYVSSSAAGSDGEKVDNRLQAAIKKLASTKDAHVLLVSDTHGFAQKGVAINFLINRQDNAINLEISRDAERRAGLSISSRLLGLSIVQVIGDEKRDDAGSR